VKLRRNPGNAAIRAWLATAVLALSLPLVFASDRPFEGTANGEWRYWGGDEASTRYSPLDQINAESFKNLEVVWRWRAANYGPEVPAEHVALALPE